MSFLMIFFATFFNVFLLGLNSQYVRDQAVARVFMISWGISLSQFIFARIAANTSDLIITFMCGGSGGAMGIVSSIYFYRWMQNRNA